MLFLIYSFILIVSAIDYSKDKKSTTFNNFFEMHSKNFRQLFCKTKLIVKIHLL